LALASRIKDKSAHICVLGLGYVGLPLAVGLADVGYQVIGLDISKSKVRAIQEGQSYILDVSAQDVARLVTAAQLRATTDYDILSKMDVIFICVPTPFDAMKAPDLSAIVAASNGIAKRLRAGQLIILQSTT